MSVLAPLLALLGLVVAVEAFRSITRRRLVAEWVRAQGWTLNSIHYRLPRRNDWTTYFDVRVTEASGRVIEGEARASGFIRRKVWMDWEGSGRGM